MADDLFEVLRIAFRVNVLTDVDIRTSDALVTDPAAERRHLALNSLLCTQRLRLLGSRIDAFDHDEAYVLLNALNVLIQRLLENSPDDSPPIRRLHDVHGRVLDLAMAIDKGLLDGHVDRDDT